MEKVVVDTNILLDEPSVIERFDNIVILSHVVRELEKHKLKKELAYQARRATRMIEENYHRVHFDGKDYKPQFDKYADDYYEDNKIVQACIENGYSVMSNDMLLKHKARLHEVRVVDFLVKDVDEYTGYKEIEASDQELADFQEKSHINSYQLEVNQYLIASHPFGKTSSTIFKWNGERHVIVESIPFHSDFLGKLKAMDDYQRCAMDSVRSNAVSILEGPAGSGKTLIALNYAISEQSKGNIGKIIMFTSNIPVAGTQGIGFLPGTREEKLTESGLGNILSSKFGNRDEVYGMLQTGKLELLPMSDIRGYDTGSNACIILTEAQNTSKELMKLALQRVGDGSKVIIDGDANAQVDKDMFAGDNNGMRAVSKAFRGESIFGEVQLKTIQRSEIARIADRI